MARDLFRAELGIHITGENADSGVKYLFGAVAPAIEAEVGSLYNKTDDGTIWRKVTAGTGTDKWEKIPTSADISLKFRNEQVVAATGDVAPASGSTIDLSLAPFSDDEGTKVLGADFVAGSTYVIFGVGGTPKLMKVSVVAADVITVIDTGVVPLATGDSFVVRNYLPDSPDAQEGMALVNYNAAGAIVKLADFNWAIADSIALTSGYSAVSGNVTSADSVNSAISKLDGVNDAQDSALGLSQGATNFGSFTGAAATILSASQSAKQLFQQLATYVAGLFTLTKKKETAITTVRVIDAVNCQAYNAAKWFVCVALDSAPAQKQCFEVWATHDGNGVIADAVNTDETLFAKIKVGANFAYTVATALSGVGAAQVMQLTISAPAAVTVTATRLEVNQ